jgi:hypothetical protein
MPKIFKSVHSRKMKEPVSEEKCPTDKLPSYSVTYFFVSLQSPLSLVWILSNTFFLCGVSFVTLSKPSSLERECHALHFGEELWKLTLSKPYYSKQLSHTFNDDKIVLPHTKIIINVIIQQAKPGTVHHYTNLKQNVQIISIQIISYFFSNENLILTNYLSSEYLLTGDWEGGGERQGTGR